MPLRKTSIQGKLLRLIILINVSVLVLTCSIFFAYEYFTFRQARMREATSLGKIIATNSTAALAFDDREAAHETLNALQSETRITAACLYDANGKLFAYFPEAMSPESLPAAPAQDGFVFTSNTLIGFQPVTQESKRLGTLYVAYTMEALYDRLKVQALLAGGIMVLSSLLAYVIYLRLRSRISKPILALAETARAISDKHDFSVRAVKSSEDEIGLFTDAFNHMLDRIQQQNSDLMKIAEQIRASEQRFRILIESNADVVSLTDKNLTVFYQSPQGETITGYTEAERAALNAQDLLHPEDIGALAEAYPKLFTEPDKPVFFQYRFKHKLGHYIWLEGSIKNLLDDPNIHAIVVNFRDVTEKKTAEKEILKLNAELEERVLKRTRELQTVNKELESFSYSVSHDLRAPLRSIHGYVNILLEQYGPQLDDEAKRLIGIVMKNSQRMGQLIDDLLAFSKLGRAELTRSMISMQHIAADVMEECLRGEEHRKVDVQIATLPNALADSTTIKQVWVNLISNALKYSRQQEHAKIEIGFSENEKEITYFIKDNGAGFDMKYYEKLFGVFQRLHSTKDFEGTGVGLAIVQRIIARHGGRIWADGKVKEGATFYFTLNKE
jgi:PAS domain S-box-containing protein